MLWSLILVCVVKSAWSDNEHVDSRVVETKQGAIRGYKSPHGDFYVFYGVPYATAPTGSQRFQAPLPPPILRETFEAVDRSIVCPQFNYYGLVLNGNQHEKENCLVANIYAPKTEETKLPVLVNIHGGAFAIGFSEHKSFNNLAKSKKVVIVNFNYRLGAHGFLCLGTKDVPGNAGMKDQVALLRWVKDNIASFGGNPDDVTIAGYSAGSSSVDLLILSKMANGLFKKVIPESGANIATFAIQLNPIENAKNYAKQLNFSNVDDISALEEFYKTVPYDLLTSINFLEGVDGAIPFTPCVERDVGFERFLDDSPINILKSGNFPKYPMLYGFSRMEGLIRINLFEFWKDMMNTKFSDFLPVDLQFENENEKEEVAAKVKTFYFGTTPVNSDNIMGYVNYFTDTMFAYTILRSLRFQVEAGNNQIYLYEFSFTHENSMIIPYIGIHGADHCSQSWTVQDGLNLTHSDESLASDSYKNFKRVTREVWLNFVTTGKPIPDGSSLPMWHPAGPDGSPYMVLDQPLVLMETPLLKERMQLWDQIYRKHYRQPVPPATSPALKTEL